MDEIVKTAGQQSGWVAALFVAIVLGGFGGFGFIIRQLWTDHRALNEFVREVLTAALNRNSVALTTFGEVLKDHPCGEAKPDKIDAATTPQEPPPREHRRRT